ncbi:MAG: hypothetical protein MUD12_00370 [Spirochaetes bacterium]|jgi:hypothetical protein|nr:hypothetical protein [Spirochaetota bacterium]
MGKLDKTKDNLKITNLDDRLKKELLDKFLKAGGKVLDEKQMRRMDAIDKNKKSRDKKKRLEEFNRREKSGKKNAEAQKTSQQPKTLKPAYVPSESFFEIFKLKLKLKFYRITDWGGKSFNVKFFETFNNLYVPSLLEVQMLYLELFKKNLMNGYKIIDRLDKIKPIYYELIEKAGNLYDKMNTDHILEHFLFYRNVPKRTIELKDEIVSLYKKLVVLVQFENTLYDGINFAISIYSKSDKETASESSLRRKARNNFYIIFRKLYPRLHLLFCIYNGKFYYPYDFDNIIRALSIPESEKPGRRRAGQALIDREEELAKDDAAKIAEDNSGEIPLPIRIGLSMMHKLDLEKMRREYDKSKLFEFVGLNDKVLITFLLFNEFDKEYSVILTTNKIKYNVDFGAQGKSDYRIRLQDLYDEMRKPSETLRAYSEELESYEKFRRERPADNTQYMDYTKRLEAVEKNRLISGRNARGSVKGYMDRLTAELKVLIDDMDGVQKIIANPQDILEFDVHIEGDKKINGRKIYEAFLFAFNFAAALSYRLQSGGDLSGSIEFSEPDQKPPADIPQNETKTETESESVLDELNDLL